MAFHRRDSEEVAERVTPSSLAKGLLWGDSAACLFILFSDAHAQVRLEIDRVCTGHQRLATQLEHRVRLMLGLCQPIEAFERQHGSHAQLGALVRSFAGLRIPVAASPFEALSWAIIGQQISVGAAISIRRRLIRVAGIRHSSGLWCFPQPQQIEALSHDDLRAAGLSAGKVRTFDALCAAIASGELSLDVQGGQAEALGAQLLQIKGIGPWTVNYVLMRGFGWLDGSLHGDVAVRRGLQRLLGLADRPSETQTRTWLSGFSPWRALVAAHLWALDARPEP
ncbi:DNA-3-methyladenine glycosylase 2 [Marinobacterium rhizophilum]|uniref:DNA-3-methyladenine glycosylase II n=1 Tax=Marinobacterium rhizophilum TaxID=420402 RepID=A0ABY5HTL5_9GAMM|nr:DNA-3-methyladenine glycosylase 2 [Marinobacterium rhizophilum]